MSKFISCFKVGALHTIVLLVPLSPWEPSVVTTALLRDVKSQWVHSKNLLCKTFTGSPSLMTLAQEHSFLFLESLPHHSVQALGRVRLFATPWIAAHQASLSMTNSWSLLRLMPIQLVMPSSHLILLCPSPPAPNPSQHQGLFQWVNSSHQVAKVLSPG